MSYINLGGIKLLWGVTSNVLSSSGANVYYINFPSGFFSSISYISAGIVAVTATQDQQAIIQAYGPASAVITFYANTASGAATGSYLVIGS